MLAWRFLASHQRLLRRGALLSFFQLLLKSLVAGRLSVLFQSFLFQLFAQFFVENLLPLQLLFAVGEERGLSFFQV